MPAVLDHANPAATASSAAHGRAAFTSQIEDPIMQVRDLDFYYGKFRGLKKVNLDVARRKVTAFIGPSGCGKSTRCAPSTACSTSIPASGPKDRS